MLSFTSIRPITIHPILQYLITSFPTNLQELHLDYCLTDQRTLVALLRNLNELRTLKICHYGEPIRDLLDGLAGEPVFSMEKDEQLCPKLQHVDFSQCARLAGGMLVRLVKSHMAASQTASILVDQSSEFSDTLQLANDWPIQTMIVNECPAIDNAAIPWLRAKVPNFSCVFIVHERSGKRQGQRWL